MPWVWQVFSQTSDKLWDGWRETPQSFMNHWCLMWMLRVEYFSGDHGIYIIRIYTVYTSLCIAIVFVNARVQYEYKWRFCMYFIYCNKKVYVPQGVYIAFFPQDCKTLVTYMGKESSLFFSRGSFLNFKQCLHPRKLTWIPKLMVWKR